MKVEKVQVKVKVATELKIEEYKVLINDRTMDPGTRPNSISGRGLANLQVDHSTGTSLLTQHTKQVGYSVTFVNLLVWHLVFLIIIP